MSLARIQLLNAALRCPTAFKENLSVVVVTRDAEVLSDFIKRFNCIGWRKVAANGIASRGVGGVGGVGGDLVFTSKCSVWILVCWLHLN